MDCDKCGKPAKVHLTQLVGGQVKKVALCNECAGESGVTDPTGFALADMLLGPTGPAMAKAKSATVTSSGGPACPTCGFTLEDLKRVRRFGCGNCYSAFRTEVMQMLRGMHKGTTHRGKVPDGLMEMQQRRLLLGELREKLEIAVASENYEEAAGIRDQIISLEGEAPIKEGRR
jgi:protein arginine kinase activator